MFTIVITTEEKPSIGNATFRDDHWVTVIQLESPTMLIAIEKVLNKVSKVKSLAIAPGRTRPEQTMLPEIWGLNTAARYLGMTREGVRKMVLRGDLPAKRADNSWIVFANDVRTLKKNRK